MATRSRTVLICCALLAAALLVAAPAPAQDAPAAPHKPSILKSSCFACHSEFDDEDGPTAGYKEDIHFLKGFGCEDCHGGNPAAGGDGDMDAAHDEQMGFKGAPKRTLIPEFCASCHSDAAFMKRFAPDARVDQLAEYRTSVHGKRAAEGDGKVAVCSDCHGVHGILKVDDPRAPVYPTRVAEMCAGCHARADIMGPYGQEIDQFQEYKQSVHAAAIYEKGDTSAPTCNDCHGNHGAAPPGVGSVAYVCGNCHVREAGLFQEAEKRLEVDFTDALPCATCHSNHAIQRAFPEMIGVGPKSTCTDCHGEGEDTYDQIAKMGEARLKLEERLHEAAELLEVAERKGMEVGPDRYALQEGKDALVDLRVLAHSFDSERFLSAAGEGLAIADQGVEAGNQAFAELLFRRRGLAVSLVVILIFVVVLILKIRQMENA
jgi:hypothetical protein